MSTYLESNSLEASGKIDQGSPYRMFNHFYGNVAPSYDPSYEGHTHEGWTGLDIRVCDYDPSWSVSASHEIESLRLVFGENAQDIQHIGGTSVPGMISRPIIDIMVGMVNHDLSEISLKLKAMGYTRINLVNREERAFFVKKNPANPSGMALVFLHITTTGSDYWKWRIGVRDHFLKAHEDAKTYGECKRFITKNYPGDRLVYTMMKRVVFQPIAYALGFKTLPRE